MSSNDEQLMPQTLARNLTLPYTQKNKRITRESLWVRLPQRQLNRDFKGVKTPYTTAVPALGAFGEQDCVMAEPPTPPPTALSPAEQEKRLGNDAFARKAFDEAMIHYGNAIKLDGDSPAAALYYSNRSACHAGKGSWKEALEDAKMSVQKDPRFIKGYLRIATAQLELQNFDDAESTLNAAIMVEPGHDLVLKQLQTVKMKRMASKTGGLKREKKLSVAQQKELMELQEQLTGFSRDLRGVVMKIGSLEKSKRGNRMTGDTIGQLPDGVPLYRTVGKAFIFADKPAIESHLASEMANAEKQISDLQDRKEYLERRIKSTKDNANDIITSALG